MQQKSVYIYLNFYAYPLAIQLFASVLSENIENLVMQYIRKYIYYQMKKLHVTMSFVISGLFHTISIKLYSCTNVK